MIPDDEKANELARWMFRMTTGVPASVQYILQEHMYGIALEQGRFINWSADPKNDVLDRQACTSFPYYELPSPEFVHLFKLAMIGRLLPYNAVYQSRSLLELATQEAFFITTSPNYPNHFKLVITRSWARQLNMIYRNPMDDLKSIYFPTLTVDRKPFQRHVEQRILLTCNYPPNETLSVVQAFPFFTGTMVQDENLSGCALLEMGKATKKNRRSLVQEMMAKSSGCVLVRPADKSAMPDLLMLLPAAIDAKRFIIGWQMIDSDLSESELWNQVDKFVEILSTKVCLGGVLVIVLNAHGDKYVEALRGIVKNIPPKRTSGPVTSSAQSCPPVELVILKQDELETLVGAYILEFLSKHSQ
jgi:hypothetical protein